MFCYIHTQHCNDNYYLRPWYAITCKVQRIEVGYWRADNPKLFESSSFPTFLYAEQRSGFGYYGLPIEEYPGLVKVF